MTNTAAKLYEATVTDLGFQVGTLTGADLADIYEEYVERWDRFLGWETDLEQARARLRERPDGRYYTRELSGLLAENLSVRPVVMAVMECGFTWPDVRAVLAGDSKNRLNRWWPDLEDWESFQEWVRTCGYTVDRKALKRYVQQSMNPDCEDEVLPEGWPYNSTLFGLSRVFGFQLLANGERVQARRRDKKV